MTVRQAAVPVLTADGLLLVTSQSPPGRDDEFNDWYDGEHAPARVTVPGISTARRYTDLGAANRYLALYDLAPLSVLDGAPYRALAAAGSEREREIMAASTMDRRVYRRIATPPVSNAEDLSICTDVVLCVWWTPPEGGAEDLHAWYEQEHIPMLMEVPGWRRIRRYAPVTGGSSFLAVHDLDSPEVLDHPRHRAAVQTPWRDRVVAARVGYDRGLYRLRSRFEGA